MADSFLEELVTLTLDNALTFTSQHGSIEVLNGLPYGHYESTSHDPDGTFRQYEEWTKDYKKGDVTLSLKKVWMYTEINIEMGKPLENYQNEDRKRYTLNYISGDKHIEASRIVTKKQEGKRDSCTVSDSCWQVHQGLQHLPALIEFLFVNNPQYAERTKPALRT